MIIRTVTGDIAPEALGLTLGHEHIFAEPPADVSDPDLRIDDEAGAESELAAFRRAGGGAIIEMTTLDYGRSAAVLAHLSRKTGVHIVSATGFNQGKFADRISSQRTTDQIADWMVEEVTRGIDGSNVRAGVIKAASGLNGPGADERRVFVAAAQAHRRTNAPISTHTEKGTWALGQIELFRSEGVEPGRVLLGHLDLNPDPVYLAEVAATGAFMGFDQFAKAKYLPDARRIELIAGLVDAGHGSQIIIGGDMARRSSYAWGGGPGFVHVPLTIRPALREAGLSAAAADALSFDNPKRLLAFEPVEPRA